METQKAKNSKAQKQKNSKLEDLSYQISKCYNAGIFFKQTNSMVGIGAKIEKWIKEGTESRSRLIHIWETLLQ